MPHIFDLHFHSVHSDGNGWPREIVARARSVNPGVTHLGLSDHNTFSGCREFVESCNREGIHGFVMMEIATHLPELDVEVEFLTCLGDAWDTRTAQRADRFTPYFNDIHRVDTANLFTLLEGACDLGLPVSIRDVNATLLRHHAAQSEPRDPCAVRPVTLWDLMGVLRQHPRPDGTCVTVDDIWKHMGKRPLPQPSAEWLFRIYRDAAPAVILAHPHNYKVPPEKLAPHLARWRSAFNFIGLECWHRGTFRPEWKQLADDQHLLASAGSDAHNAMTTWNIPVVEDGAANVPALFDKLVAAGRG
jgi:predicted metal-dependent phosphoesterase TrpH